jgi:hypothetical protein
MMATKEQETILKMVAAGTVTVEQAAELLDALGPAREPPRPRPASDIGNLLEEVLSRALGSRLGGSFVAPAPPRPPRPPRPPEPRRSARPHRSSKPFFAGGPDRQGLSFEELVELKTEGVPKSYIDEMGDLFPEIDLGELLECHEGGVEPSYARAMLAIFGELDVPQLVELRESGVDATFAAALLAEFPDLEPSDVIEAAEEGVHTEDVEFFRMRGARGRPDREGDGDDPPAPGAPGGEGPIPV